MDRRHSMRLLGIFLLMTLMLSSRGFANPCTVPISVSATSLHFGGLQGSQLVRVSVGGNPDITSACTWSGAPDQSFISISPFHGGGGTNFTTDVTVSVTTNPDFISRSGTITFQQSPDGSEVRLPVNQDPNPGNFTLSIDPSSQNIVPGGSNSYTVRVNRSGGFTGSVFLSASGQPSGTSVTFSPNPATGESSTMTVTATGATCDGNSSITVTGQNAGVQRQAFAGLNVVGDFSLSVSPVSENVAQGNSTSANVTITRSQGFAGAVTLSAPGPTGVTTTFSPNGTTGNSSTMTITATNAALPGTFPLTITGSTGCLTHTAADSVSVAPSWWPAIEQLLLQH